MESYGPVMLRLVVGGIFATHAAEALFGPPSAEPVAVLAAAVACVACAAGLLLVAGGWTGYVSAALIAIVLGSFWNVPPVNGLLPVGAAARHGLELHLIVLASLVSLLLTGPGALSVDNRRRRSAEAYAAGRARLRSRL